MKPDTTNLNDDAFDPIRRGLDKICYAVADIFRDVDPQRTRDHLLALFMLRCLPDINIERYGDHDGTNRALVPIEARLLVVPEQSRFSVLVKHATSPQIGGILNRALYELGSANPEIFRGVFDRLNFDYQERARYQNGWGAVLELLETIQLDRSNWTSWRDLSGRCFEYLLEWFAAETNRPGWIGHTPRQVCRLISELLVMESATNVYDPVSGTGTLLATVAMKVEGGGIDIYGQDADLSDWSISIMNALAHGFDPSGIMLGDVLAAPAHVEDNTLKKFDVVVTNFPFSVRNLDPYFLQYDSYNRFYRGTPPRSRADYAFLSHIVESMRPGHGKGGVVAPLGVLSRKGVEEHIRRSFVEENIIEAVILLPPSLFFGTAVSAVILMLNKGKQTSDILFVDASSGYRSGKGQSQLREADISRIAEAARQLVTVPGFSYRAPVEEVRRNNYNLSPLLYVHTTDGKKDVQLDVWAIDEEIMSLEKQAVEIKSRIGEVLKKLGV